MKLLRFWRDLRILLDQNKKVENILKDNQENEDVNCGTSFKPKEGFWKHGYRVHGCTKCGTTFKPKEEFWKHGYRVHGRMGCWFVFCSVVFVKLF